MKSIKLGPVLWISSIQFFIVQIIVGLAWPVPYSIPANTISDLGNSACDIYSGRYVCSPLYSWMNASFIALGITMFIGSLLIYKLSQKSRARIIGFGLMALAGVGTALVGIYPENTIASLHVLGAGLSLAVGALSLLVLGLSLDIPRAFRVYSIISGIVSLAALLLFITHNYLGIGIGGMERISAHPITIWLIIFGIYRYNKHIKSQRSRRN